MTYDIVVIGGGLLGASIARDAAGRGLSVCVFEQEDFGAGATSRGSRLAAAGLNALETLDFTRVREDIREREILRRMAPHLVQPQPCLIPFYGQGLLAQTRLRAGLALIDALGFDQSLPVHHLLSPSEAQARAPGLRAEGLAGAALVWEAVVPRIERLALEIALDARRQGACLRTHTRVEALCWEREPRGRERAAGVRWRDRLTGEEGQTDVDLVVAAAGAWQSDLKASFLGASVESRPRLVKSVSICGPPLSGRGDTLVLPHDEEGRFLLVTSWPGGCWVGSIETDFTGDLDTAHATGEEVAALIRLVPDFLPNAAWDEMTGAQAAVYAPLPPPAGPFGAALPPYDIRDHAANGGVQDGLVTASGAGVTSVRAVAEEVVDLACRKLGRALSTPPCRTASLPLPAPAGPTLDGPIPNDRALRAAAEWAVAEEECRTLRDFLERRAPPAWTADGGRSAVPLVLPALADLLGWDSDRQAHEVKAYEADRALTQAFRVL